MVKKHIILITILFIFVSSNAIAQTVVEDTYTIRPYKMTKVKSVIIKDNGAWSKGLSSSHETPKMCASFKLKKRDVNEFFRRSRRISHRTYIGDLDASRCYANGDVVFENGDKGTWMIDAARRGFLKLSDSRDFYFYCTKCTAKVFYNE